MDGALINLAERLQATCVARGIGVSVAESCTGGLVAASITEVSGSSAYFLGGIVSYANTAKEALLDVPSSVLQAHGAVSAQVARAMADGALARFGADLAVAITGVAGPEGGTAEKPVGLVYVGLSSAAGADVRRLHLVGDRREIRAAATRAALEWLVEASEAPEATRS